MPGNDEGGIHRQQGDHKSLSFFKKIDEVGKKLSVILFEKHFPHRSD
jgi:hypothetical protein